MPETAEGPTVASERAKAAGITELRREAALLKADALQNAILASATFAIIATDERASSSCSTWRRAHAGL